MVTSRRCLLGPPLGKKSFCLFFVKMEGLTLVMYITNAID